MAVGRPDNSGHMAAFDCVMWPSPVGIAMCMLTHPITDESRAEVCLHAIRLVRGGCRAEAIEVLGEVGQLKHIVAS